MMQKLPVARLFVQLSADKHAAIESYIPQRDSNTCQLPAEVEKECSARDLFVAEIC